MAVSPPVGPNSRHLLPGSDYASLVTGKNDPNRAGAHLGLDFQPERPGNPDPINWVEDGVITRIVRNRTKGDRRESLYAGHTGNAVEWRTAQGHIWHIRHMPTWAISHLKVGQKVKAGTKASNMGTTGNSNGVHLHLGLRIKGRFVDPEPVLKEFGGWPFNQPKPKPKPTPAPVIKPAEVIKKEWSDMASKEEIAELFDERLIHVLKTARIVPWTNSETGEETKYSVVDALRYGLAVSTVEKAVTNVLTENRIVPWTNSGTGEKSLMPVADALGFGGSLQWNREIERDAARTEAGTTNDDASDEAPKDDSDEAPKDAEPVQPSSPPNP